MDVNYQLTVDDFRRAIQAYRTRTPLLRWTVRFGVGLTVLVLATGLILLVLAPHSAAFRNLIPLYIFFTLWTILFWASPYRSARSQFRGSPSAKAPITLDVTDARLHFRSQHTDSTIAWSAYIKWLEEREIFALFPNPKLFIVIPKRAFTAEQTNEFRELLRQHVKPQ
jgi:YcxB-like protein